MQLVRKAGTSCYWLSKTELEEGKIQSIVLGFADKPAVTVDLWYESGQVYGCPYAHYTVQAVTHGVESGRIHAAKKFAIGELSKARKEFDKLVAQFKRA